MESILNNSVFGAISYMWALALSIGSVLPGPVRKKNIKLFIFAGLMLPYVVFFFKFSLISHLVMAAGMILLVAMLFGSKLYISCYTVVLSYLIVTCAMLSAHVVSFISEAPLSLNGVMAYPSQARISIIHILVTLIYVKVYRVFVRFFKGQKRGTKKNSKILAFVHCVGFMLLLIESNIYLRFLMIYFSELKRVPRLTYILVFGYVGLVVMTVGFIYLLSITILSRLHLHEVKESAQKDLQTGVLNRQTGLDTLGQRIKLCKQGDYPLTICFVDINNLKQVNDRYGHKAGDQLIEVVSTTIRGSLRDNDFIFRLGGDEFIIAFCDSGLIQAKTAWNRIQAALVKRNSDSQLSFPVSVSYGFAEYNAIESLSIMDFIEQADTAMYLHKNKYKQIKKTAALDSADSE